MAYLTNLKCYECGKEYRSDPKFGDFCGDCRNRIEKIKKMNWLNERRIDKTIKERIEFIEDWIYKNKDKIHSSHITDIF